MLFVKFIFLKPGNSQSYHRIFISFFKSSSSLALYTYTICHFISSCNVDLKIRWAIANFKADYKIIKKLYEAEVIGMCILEHTFEYKLQITNQIIDLLDMIRYIFYSKKKTGHKVSFLKVFNLNIHVCSKLRYDRILLPVYNTIR